MYHRLKMPGLLKGQELVNAYHAMDVFAFASKTETQGMVLAEAMSASIPVVAVDAAGAREIVNHSVNGLLISEENSERYMSALNRIYRLTDEERSRFRRAALKTSAEFSSEVTSNKVLDVYEETIAAGHKDAGEKEQGWVKLVSRFRDEWEIWSNRFSALSSAFQNGEDDE